jgi:hypothetical protein
MFLKKHDDGAIPRHAVDLHRIGFKLLSFSLSLRHHFHNMFLKKHQDGVIPRHAVDLHQIRFELMSFS